MNSIQTRWPTGPEEIAPWMVGVGREGRSLEVIKASRRWCHWIVWVVGRRETVGLDVSLALCWTRDLMFSQSNEQMAGISELQISRARDSLCPFVPFVSVSDAGGRNICEEWKTPHPNPV